MSETNHKRPEIQYDFFRVDLWTSRIGSIDNALDATVRVLRGVLVTVDGFTVEKLAKLIRTAGGEDYTKLVADLITASNSDGPNSDGPSPMGQSQQSARTYWRRSRKTWRKQGQNLFGF